MRQGGGDRSGPDVYVLLSRSLNHELHVFGAGYADILETQHRFCGNAAHTGATIMFAFVTILNFLIFFHCSIISLQNKYNKN